MMGYRHKDNTKKGFDLAKCFEILESTCAASQNFIQDFERNELKKALELGIEFNIQSKDTIDFDTEICPKLAMKMFQEIQQTLTIDPTRTGFKGTLAKADGKDPSIIVSDSTGPLFIVGGNYQFKDKKEKIIKYQKDGNGNFLLDKNGNKIPEYQKDANGNFILDENDNKKPEYERDAHGFIKERIVYNERGIKKTRNSK